MPPQLGIGVYHELGTVGHGIKVAERSIH